MPGICNLYLPFCLPPIINIKIFPDQRFINLKYFTMKKIFSNNRLIAIAFFTVFSATAVSAASDSSNLAMPVELKLIGSINDQPLFQLSYAGTTGQDDFTIIIRDEDGNSLYRENIKGESFTKKFLLNRDEVGSGTLRFEITSKKNSKTVVYEVNRNTREVEDLVINKM